MYLDLFLLIKKQKKNMYQSIPNMATLMAQPDMSIKILFAFLL